MINGSGLIIGRAESLEDGLMDSKVLFLFSDPKIVRHPYLKLDKLVEQGFKFLKDKPFRIAVVYLKSEKRIEA